MLLELLINYLRRFPDVAKTFNNHKIVQPTFKKWNCVTLVVISRITQIPFDVATRAKRKSMPNSEIGILFFPLIVYLQHACHMVHSLLPCSEKPQLVNGTIIPVPLNDNWVDRRDGFETNKPNFIFFFQRFFQS